MTAGRHDWSALEADVTAKAAALLPAMMGANGLTRDDFTDPEWALIQIGVNVGYAAALHVLASKGMLTVPTQRLAVSDAELDGMLQANLDRTTFNTLIADNFPEGA